MDSPTPSEPFVASSRSRTGTRLAFVALALALLTFGAVVVRAWSVLGSGSVASRLFLDEAPGDLEFGSVGRLQPIWTSPNGAPPLPSWRAWPLRLNPQLQSLVERHWLGWTVDAWAIRPQHTGPFELVLFDVRQPASRLLEHAFSGSRQELRLGTALRLGSADVEGRMVRCAQFQLLRFDEDAVRVLDTRTWSGSWLPPVDERKAQGWRREPPCGGDFGGPWNPVLAWWSWNGESSVWMAANVLWPSKGQVHSTAAFDDREEAARRIPLRAWPFPTLVLSVERPEVSTPPDRSPLELSRRTLDPSQIADEGSPGDLQIREGLSIGVDADPDDSTAAKAKQLVGVWRTRGFTLEAPCRQLIAEHWRGWTIDAWCVEPPNDEPFELSLFDVRRPKTLLLKQSFPRRPLLLGAAYRLGSIGRGSHSVRSARFQLLTFESNGVRVLATCEWTGDWLPPPDMQEPAGWKDPLVPDSLFGGTLHPVLASWSWNGELSASMAANVLWPSKVPVPFTTPFDERERVAWSAPLPAWPFPTLVLAVERPEVTTPSAVEGPEQLQRRR